VSTNKNSATDQSSEIELQSESNHSIAKNTKRKESRVAHGNTVSKKAKIVNVSHSSEEEEKQNYILMRRLCNFDLPNSQIPTCWSGTKLGVNPQTNIIHVYAEKAIYEAKTEIIKMEKSNLRAQLFEANQENDVNTVMEIVMELEGTTLMNSHCEIQLCQVELDTFLKHVFKKDVIWDLGYWIPI